MTLFDSGVPYTRLISVSGNMQRYRMMRYVMVLGIILVTIFLYVSYYTTPMAAVDSRYSAVYVSQEQQQQSHMQRLIHEDQAVGGDAQNFYPPPSSQANVSGDPVVVERDLPSQAQQETSPQKTEEMERMPGPSEAAKGAASSTSNNMESTRAEVRTMDGVVAVPREGQSGNLTLDLEQRAKANVSIVIPKVVVPSKTELLKNLTTSHNATKSVTAKSPAKPSKIKMTRDIYEPGFMVESSELCPNNGENIRLLVLVHSAPSHVESRYAIRQTWGHYGTRRDIVIAFLVGRTNNATWEASLEQELFMYGDIVRSNSFDSYDNLTLKTISMLEWTDAFCSQAKFLLKVDDDMFINIPKLLEFTKSHWNDTRQIYGRLAKKWRPIRNIKSKYYVSPAVYAPKNFPDFVTGPSYLMTTDTLRELFEASLTHAFLKLEDVYMTGIISEMVKVKRKHVNEFLNRRIAFNPCAVRKAISIHMVKGKEQFDLWKKLLDVDLKCK